MGESTGISWCDHTFNPVWGCTKISPACDFCYAETWDKRVGGDHWGPHAQLREFGDKHWNEPLAWDRAAEKAGVMRRVFCASMADVFDKRWPEHVRPRLWRMIRATPHLEWLLLTKRPENVADRLPEDWGAGYPNVMLGVTVESREYLLRAWTLLTVAGEASRIFISYEPALGPLGRLRDVWHAGDRPRLAWLICGGESGPHARPMHPDWARDARDQCAELGIAFHLKQWGEWTPGENVDRQAGIVKTATWFDDRWLIDDESLANTEGHRDDEPDLYRVGKKAAGRFLDGVTHDAFPEPPHA